MITKENITEVVNQLNQRTKKRILNSDKEYCVLYLHVFNIGSYTTARVTDDFDRYKNISNNGNVIIDIQEIKDIIHIQKVQNMIKTEKEIQNKKNLI